jgi:hypothetical protein
VHALGDLLRERSEPWSGEVGALLDERMKQSEREERVATRPLDQPSDELVRRWTGDDRSGSSTTPSRSSAPTSRRISCPS